MQQKLYLISVPLHLSISMLGNVILTPLFPGVKSYTVSLDTQTADVVTSDSVDYDTVLQTIKKTGKTVKSGEADGKEMAV